MSDTIIIAYDSSASATAQTKVNLGTVTSITNSVTKRGSAYPIVSQGVQNSFPIENGNSQSYTISFTHYNGQNGETNAVWMKKMMDMMDRWQARTDGFMLTYTPESAYMDTRTVGGYIKTMSIPYGNDYNEVLSGRIEFAVGMMHVNNISAPSDAESYSDMYILMSDANRANWFLLSHGGGADKYSCVESVNIHAGPETPFEWAEIVIPRKKLMEQIPDLASSLVDGQNLLYLNVMGKHNMFAQSIDSSGDSIKITAFCMAQRYKSATLTYNTTDTPLNIIRSILADSSLGLSFGPDNILMRYDSALNTSAGDVTMPRGTLIYRALQICARLLRCRLFFADDCAYIIDYTVSASASLAGNAEVYGAGDLILRRGKKLGARCVGRSSCDDQGGLDPVRNTCTIKYLVRTVEDETVTESTESQTVTDSESVAALDRTLDYGTVALPELNINQAKQFAQHLLYYIREPQRSMTFKLKEAYGESGKWEKKWKSFFTTCAMASSITDSYNSEHVDNESVVSEGKAYHKLILSQYTRSFPEGTCEYTFGLIASTQLSDNLSQTNNALNS